MSVFVFVQLIQDRSRKMDQKRSLKVVLLLAAIFTVTACNAGVRVIRGSGNVITEDRQVTNFDRIALEGSGEVIVTQGGGESLTVETDDNVMEHVKTEVEGGTLKLGLVTGIPTGVNVQSTTRLIFYVGVDDLSGLSISGSGDIEAETIETERLDASISGSGKVQIFNLAAGDMNADISGSGEVDLAGGETNEQDISISGSGKYLAGELCSAVVTVSVSGSGEATVCATESLEADISGSGNVNYYGRPSINTSGSGSGQLNNLGE
jgi:hypothetical protein